VSTWGIGGHFAASGWSARAHATAVAEKRRIVEQTLAAGGGGTCGVMKRDGGFATQDAAKTAGREDLTNEKSRQPDRANLGTIMVG